MNTSAACQKCTFFDDHAQTAAKASNTDGLCRFNPPISQPSPEAHGLWPVVSTNDWCGHFAPEGSAAAGVAAE